MIDFTKCEINKYKYYGGKNGGKMCVVYNGANYMLKFPSVNTEGKELLYTNSCISEYVVCHIMQSLGFLVQETLLGEYEINGHKKIVVACKDFTNTGVVLKQFAELKNSQIETSKNGYGTELVEILEAIKSQDVYDSQKLKEFFWDMFIADALVGNFDRHNGNWGFLVNEEKEKIEIAPLYDCASCLYPQLSDDRINEVIKSDEEMYSRVRIFPTSSIKVNDKKINYFEYITSMINVDCNEAVKRVVPKIDFEVIDDIIDRTPYITNIRKEFYKKILRLRYDNILKPVYEKIK